VKKRRESRNAAKKKTPPIACTYIIFWWCVSSWTALVLTMAFSNRVSFGGEIIHYTVSMYHLTTVYLMIIFIYSPVEPLLVDAVRRRSDGKTIIPGRTCKCPWLAAMLAPITILKTEVKFKKKKEQFNNLTRRGQGCVTK